MRKSGGRHGIAGDSKDMPVMHRACRPVTWSKNRIAPSETARIAADIAALAQAGIAPPPRREIPLRMHLACNKSYNGYFIARFATDS
jgi:hypothetical protein